MTRRAQLIDGSYVEIVQKEGGWTYEYTTATATDEVPSIYSSQAEAEDYARNRFELELVTDFVDDDTSER